MRKPPAEHATRADQGRHRFSGQTGDEQKKERLVSLGREAELLGSGEGGGRENSKWNKRSKSLVSKVGCSPYMYCAHSLMGGRLSVVN